MGILARVAVLSLGIGLLPPFARAQQPAPSASEAPRSPPEPAASATAAAAAHPLVPATGYGWSTPTHKAERGAPHVARRADAPEARMPGFETLADGSSRLFVELSKPVTYETKSAPGTITYVLKDAIVSRRNNYNPLVTIHFNTPVTRARLVPRGRDLLFVVDLRANVQPTVALDAGKDGGSVIRIEFPKGQYLPAPPAAAESASPPAAKAASASPAPTP